MSANHAKYGRREQAAEFLQGHSKPIPRLLVAVVISMAFGLINMMVKYVKKIIIN